MPVLIVIDMLNGFLAQWEPEQRSKLIENTNRLVRHFRSCGWPVIWIRQEFEADLSDAFLEMRDRNIVANIKGTREVEIAEGLDIDVGDIVIVKKRYSAFFGTDLDIILKELNAGEIVLCGINTHACVRMTAIDAYQRDYQVILAREATGSYDDEHAAVTLRYLDGKIVRVLSVAEITAAQNAPISFR
ncbi:cysteine hydrolase family protein [Rhizobium sp. L1K21]|uniref:cysteine hydrolase family protein n=1 Tax=Rhizobium sp. L1K21 TaxID=2954933 RepID=UPI002093E7D9|nr:isochorismatase family cysteine hydrolase [Rhizobium sp. L1K21]MCO6187387.1 cysteine hydrolase [Rhizobium sp. L1K21]